MIRRLIILLLFCCIVLGAYDVGDQISIDRQNMEFEFCYPGNQVGNSFSFAQHNGNLNGGNYQVLMIEISATW